MIVLGIDTSLRCTGLGVVDDVRGVQKILDYGLIKTSATKPRSECLARLHGGVREMIDKYKLDAVSIEGVFFSRNVKTSIILGEARGAVISACSMAGLPVFEYAPRSVKQSLVGFGGAQKQQMVLMIMTRFGLREPPPEDAADALAIALCHINATARVRAVALKPL